MATKSPQKRAGAAAEGADFKSVSIRWPPAVYAEAARLAELDDRSFNQWVVRAVKAAIAKAAEAEQEPRPKKAVVR